MQQHSTNILQNERESLTMALSEVNSEIANLKTTVSEKEDLARELQGKINDVDRDLGAG